MNKKISFGACTVLIIIAAILTYQITVITEKERYEKQLSAFTLSPSLSPKLTEVMEITESMFVKDIDQKVLEDSTVEGYIEGLQDKHSVYMSQEEFEEFRDNSLGNMHGIGINILCHPDTREMVIYRVTNNSPAYNAGLIKGDIIVAVNDKSYEELGYEGSYYQLLGDEGESVKITVSRDGQELSFDIIRSAFEQQTVEYSLCQSSSSIGYIRIFSFNDTTPEQFKSAVNDLIHQGARSFIFDVRQNPGGTLDSVCEILDFLLPEGPIVRLIDKDENMTTHSSDASEFDYHIVTLADGDSASAAELFVAALKDYQKATFVGTQTYGKGTAQSTIELSDGSAVKLSTQYYLPPFSPNFDGVGVTPDRTVELSEHSKRYFELISEQEDEQLMHAIEILKDK